ncbi:Tfp pilus assembly protein PilW [Bhargavaea cecembensis DSE10]|uniref:Tfp pilus assembly protein PilW n=1 Tax=Bhargavaea cecembensis DSE10 TaxID=1235279 RepID=M7P3T8_9BACL|nr:prepilin-type N-terminal cleavage/methylation domain-containing protein [Bhargavaea cecembensis]EMR05199.1 Tfp pilus assembly protein PilW [Bhargavaea cecembensis DSE10]
MMKKIQEQKGMTLVELIAALALAGMVVVIIMTIFSIGTRYQSLETNNLAMQQEMNLTISRITQIHRSGACYAIAQKDNGIEIITFSRELDDNRNELRDGQCTTSTKSSSTYSSEDYGLGICRVSLQDTKTVCENMNSDTIIDPQRENLRARITLKDGNYKELVQETTFSRFKEEGSNEEDSTESTP